MHSDPSIRRTGPGAGSSLPTSAAVDETLLAMQDVVGRKWHPPVVYHLFREGPMGFSDLDDSVEGVSSKMLAESLDALESSGIVTRRVLSERPLRVEYDLTERGAALDGVLRELVRWGLDHGVGDAGATDGQRAAATGTSPDAPEAE